ncbi:Domain of uncharacterised function (DUF2825) [Escherichia coli]|nr:Domain of uncharacterised function (DUF2825) [Escherichia coli]
MGLKMGAGSSTAGAGELQVISIIASSAPGLSPLTRGTHMNVGSDRVFTRFIPAGAGNTRLNREGATGTAVYPRWRGEHLPTAKDWKTNLGLSPLTRGTPNATIFAAGYKRFIPADAGNSLIHAPGYAASPVYPR